MKLTNLMVNPMPNLIAANPNKRTVVDPAIVQKLQRINLENVNVSGVDLGIRNLAATITRTWDNPEIHESNVLHKSKDFHYRAFINKEKILGKIVFIIQCFVKRKRFKRKLVGSFEKEYQDNRQSSDEEPSPKSGNYRQFLNSRLKWFNQATETYMGRQVINLKFANYRSTQKTMTEMTKEMVGEVDLLGQKKEAKDCRIVFLGDCSTPANSKVRGHMRSPGNKPITRYLRQRRNTIVIGQDEYCTTNEGQEPIIKVFLFHQGSPF
ncbi:hypothetical protein Bhyg_05498 [Pseudolycoriella hygida]|uniref:Uncharacterized protein n=1 Tax=Pseudolycoriella hygida TaxID=35572 RepID=A0A9Q0N160_9DIPT|nr:hypothetical protein Bhyg_05498 [Pseudolycoriella hygida]